MRNLGVNRLLAIGAGALLAPGCASTSEFSAYRSISNHEVRDEQVFLKCREYARRLVTSAARGPIENIPEGKERLAATLGSGIGDRILFSNAVDSCMKESGYIRGNEESD